MKALNEAYQVLHDETRRKEYDAQRSQPVARAAAIHVAPAVRDVGVYRQVLSSLLSILLGLMLLFLVRFNGLSFLFPLPIPPSAPLPFPLPISPPPITNHP